MRKTLFKASIAVTIFSLAITSCSEEGKDNEEYFGTVTCDEADDSLNTYALKISTILNTNCAVSDCHDAATNEAGRNFSTYSNAVSSFTGALCAINHDNGCAAMPFERAQLSSADIHDLTCWAKNNFPQ